ncbi:MAG: ABC transporter permease [Phycisphaerales bacterium]|nr:MAG: ABC transporter permease [Phycisphaerales bacterium]
MDTFVQDIRFALRMLLKRPGFTVIIVVTLALGIGANATVFSAVNGLVLKPLRNPQLDRLTYIYAANPAQGWNRTNVATQDFLDWRRQSNSFVEMGICGYDTSNLTGGDRPERVSMVRASAGLLSVLGCKAKLGRLFGSQEDRIGQGRVVVLSEGFWQRRFGADPNVIGKTVLLDGIEYGILGVMASNQLERPLGQSDVISPFGSLYEVQGSSRGGHNFSVVGRLKPDVSVAQAQAEMETIAARLAEAYPESNRGWTVNVMPMIDVVVEPAAKMSLAMMVTAVGFVLLIVCANVANLLLSRANARQREFAIRSSLGAGKGRLVRQILTECVILSLAGGVLGVLLALWGVGAVVASLPETAVPRKYEVAVDRSVLLFTLALCFVSAALFGLAPALKTAGINLSEILKGTSRSTTAGKPGRLRRDMLVAGQVALALALVICAGLMVKSSIRLTTANQGFSPQQLLTMRMTLPSSKYGTFETRKTLFDEVVRKIRATPGVESAAAVSAIPYDRLDTWALDATVEGYIPSDPQSRIFLGTRSVTPGYFQTVGIPILKGRDFTDQDNLDGRSVIIVDENLARKFWPGEDALGKRVKLGPRRSRVPWRKVVGVVGAIKQRGFDTETRLETYRPNAQVSHSSMSVVARTIGDPLAATTALKDAVWEVDSDQAVYRVRSMEDIIFRDIGVWGVVAGLLSVFALIALVLAAVGLYGTISYDVGQRTHEIGIRIALGAQTRDALRLVLKRSVLITGIGIGAGAALALLISRMLKTIMYGVSPTDPAVFVGVTMVLIVVALLASYIPARRATKVDPMVALRCE